MYLIDLECIPIAEAYDLIMNFEEQQNEDIKILCCLDCQKNMFQDLAEYFQKYVISLLNNNKN